MESLLFPKKEVEKVSDAETPYTKLNRLLIKMFGPEGFDLYVAIEAVVNAEILEHLNDYSHRPIE